ncbi:hypothetical protein CK203_078720 [Vitis vinifera]|uniref:PPM-type phosphatase domain-containing protein n=1 Tax=Vitis vinifera TaxID=29760 RepID=A0A438E5W0_VITVI|nr:hypothetical protein CK203_078720 [Vitis vinifera]
MRGAAQASQGGGGTGRSSGLRRAKVAYTCLIGCTSYSLRRSKTGERLTAKPVRWMGSRAVVVVDAEKLVVANCGDLRAVQCRRGVAVQPSPDH